MDPPPPVAQPGAVSVAQSRSGAESPNLTGGLYCPLPRIVWSRQLLQLAYGSL